jgi:CyaY protein
MADMTEGFEIPVTLIAWELMLDERQFKLYCDQALESLNKALARPSEELGFDADLGNGTLKIDFEESGARFVVSPQTPVRQVWVSAHSKSFKLDWSPEAQAFTLPDGETLAQLIFRQISIEVGETITL